MSTLDAAYGVLPLDRDFYAAIATAPRRLIASVLVPIRTGRAWKVPSGCIVRISTPEGPQGGGGTSVSLVNTLQLPHPHLAAPLQPSFEGSRRGMGAEWRRAAW